MMISINFIETVGSVALHFDCNMEKKTAGYKVISRNFGEGRFETAEFTDFAMAVDHYKAEETKLEAYSKGAA